ncbi:MAG: hypothetical protein IT204_14535 [Fimbriimonadaceae bacterium]|nr:hypothetical protein [Fimbriimonadaceae bacterium]
MPAVTDFVLRGTLRGRPPQEPLLQLVADDGRPLVQLSGALVAGAAGLRAELQYDWPHPRNDRPLVLEWPLPAAAGPLEFVLRGAAATVDAVLCGVLVDQEWPVGGLPLATDPLRLLPAAAACLHRVTFQPGATPPAPWPTPAPLRNYWRPPGHNVGVYDIMPFCDGERFHLFYLYDRRAHRSKWGLGAHQWAHAVTADLRTWEHLPLAVGLDDPAEGSICTGSAIRVDAELWAFYAVRAVDGSPARLTWARSLDGRSFAKATVGLTLQPPYEPSSARDPVVLRLADGRWHMLVTTSLLDPPLPGRGGCLAHLSSADLEHWAQHPPFLVPGHGDQPECPDWFAWGGRWYLIHSHHGVARYRLADHPEGPWRRPRVDTFDGPQLRVLKTAAFGARRIGVGWLPDQHGRFGGQMVFRELHAAADGELTTSFVPELRPACGPPAGAAPELLAGQLEHLPDGWRLTGAATVAAADLGPLPPAGRLQVELTLAAAAGLLLRCGSRAGGGWELRLDPRRGTVGWRWPLASSLSYADATALEGVDLAGRVRLDLYLVDDLLDLCVNSCRTLAVRCPAEVSGDRLALLAHDGPVVVHSLRVAPVLTGEV